APDLWNAQTGERLASLAAPDAQSGDGSAGVDAGVAAIAFGDGGRLVVTVHAAGGSAYRAADGALVPPPSPGTTVGASSGGVAISPDGSLVAIAGEEGRVEVYEVASGLRTTMQTGAGERLDRIAFVPGAEVLVAAGQSGTAYLLPCAICAPD